MTKPDLDKLQNHLAFAAVAPTTLRGMLPIGARRLLCEELAKLPLVGLNPVLFRGQLDSWTADISKEVDAKWGPVRKGLNLFLRDAAYNHWARPAFGFDELEPLLELPLDGVVMSKLREQTVGKLPPVRVKWLTQPISDQYQEAAQALADRNCTHRVHLDLDLWNGGRP